MRFGWTLRSKYVSQGGSIASNLLTERWYHLTSRRLSLALVTLTIIVTVGPVCPHLFEGLLFPTGLKCIANMWADTSMRTDFRRFLPRQPRVGDAIGVTLGSRHGFICQLLLHPKLLQSSIVTYPSYALMRRPSNRDNFKEWSRI